jgi:hypothetical protein
MRSTARRSPQGAATMADRACARTTIPTPTGRSCSTQTVTTLKRSATHRPMLRRRLT